MATPNMKIRTESNGPLVSGIAIAFVVASALFVSLRLYTRLVLLRAAGNDDWSILAAMVLALVVTIGTVYEVKYGMGRHFENVTPEEGLEQLKFLLVVILHYNVAMNVVKISFLFQFRRIFQSNTVQKVCLGAMIFVIIWACVQATILGLSCLPIGIIVPSTAGYCLNTLPIWYFSSAVSLATDIMIFCIPLPSVLKLQLPLKQKVTVMGIFCLGFFVCIISVYRLFTLHAGVYSDDPSWENIGAAIWSVIELNTSIICSCLPTLRPLVARLLPNSGFSSARHKSSQARYGTYGNGTGSRRDTFKALKSSPRTMSTEELALKDMDTGRAGDGTVFTNVTADPELGQQVDISPQRRDYSEKKHIMVTTETTIKMNR